MKLIIGNRNYSSWSLRGWLAAKQSGLGVEELTVSLYRIEGEEVKRGRDGKDHRTDASRSFRKSPGCKKPSSVFCG